MGDLTYRRLSGRRQDERSTQGSGGDKGRAYGDAVRGLQRIAGNRAVVGLLVAAQTKTTVGAVGDPLEREADVVARRVVQTVLGVSAPGAGGRSGGASAAGVRRNAQVGAAGGSLNADSERLLRSARRGGVALDPVLQRTLGEAMGADVSAVR